MVVETGHSVAAPFAGRVLGDLGATVLKVENPEGGDDTRAWGPPFWNGTACAFQSSNPTKYSLAIDLKDSAQCGTFRQYILDRADIVLQNMRPGLIGELGLDGPGLRCDNARIVYRNLSTRFGTSRGSCCPTQASPASLAAGLIVLFLEYI